MRNASFYGTTSSLNVFDGVALSLRFRAILFRSNMVNTSSFPRTPQSFKALGESIYST